jgi:hypothetical protein
LNDPVIEYSRSLLAETREELVRADNKASILLAASGVAFGALLAAILSGDWSPTELNVRIQWLWWIGTALGAGALYFLGSAVYPRIHAHGERPSIIAYYGDVVAARDKSRVEELLEEAAKDQKQRLFDQVIQISRTVQRKYVAIRRAMWALGSGTAAGLLSVLLNAAITC